MQTVLSPISSLECVNWPKERPDGRCKTVMDDGDGGGTKQSDWLDEGCRSAANFEAKFKRTESRASVRLVGKVELSQRETPEIRLISCTGNEHVTENKAPNQGLTTASKWRGVAT